MKLSAVCITLLVAAYALLIPGLIATLFSAKASFFGIVLVDLEKSTIGTIHLLATERKWIPAGIILFFSVLAPFAKLFMILACWIQHQQKQPSDSVVKPCTHFKLAGCIAAVQRVSKWATVDALAAMIVVGFFCGKPLVTVELHSGFYCFLGYCLLSVAAALLIEVPSDHTGVADDAHSLFGHSRPTKQRPLFATFACLVVLVSFALLISAPVLRLDSESFMIHSNLSIKDFIVQLWTYNSWAAALSMAVLVVVFPVVEGLIVTLRASGYQTNLKIMDWLHDFAMLDVFALSMVVVALATSGLNKSLEMTILPKGWALCGLVAIWVSWPLLNRTAMPISNVAKAAHKADV